MLYIWTLHNLPFVPRLYIYLISPQITYLTTGDPNQSPSAPPLMQVQSIPTHHTLAFKVKNKTNVLSPSENFTPWSPKNLPSPTQKYFWQIFNPALNFWKSVWNFQGNLYYLTQAQWKMIDIHCEIFDFVPIFHSKHCIKK